MIVHSQCLSCCTAQKTEADPMNDSRLAALFAAFLLGACSGDKAAQAPAQAPVPEVGVVALEARTVTLTRELPGRTSPYVVAEVRPQVTGIVQSRAFDEGGRVKQGQLLYKLDDATLRADLLAAQAQLARAQAAHNSAKLTAERTAELAKIEAVSRQDNENAIAALRQAEADVAAGKAAVSRAEVQLGHASIESPITGRIGKSAVTQGALVTANQAQPLATVQRLDPIYVDLTQSSSELLQLRRQLAAGKAQPADTPVEIVLEDGTAYEHKGKLEFSDVTVDPATGSYLLRVVVPNPDNVLLPGAYVRAVLGNAVRENAILVPQRAVTRDPKGNATAMVLGADDKVAVRPVRVGRTVGDNWLVDEGLAAGDRVIVEGLQKVRPGVVAKGVAPSPKTDLAGNPPPPANGNGRSGGS
jgi:membrane fusion protein (multidrug efflux system)